MGLEKQRPDWSLDVLEKVKQESQASPKIPPYLFLARQLGFQGSDRLGRIDRVLAERLGGFKDEVLYPGSDSHLFSALDANKSEVLFFLDSYGYVWLSSVIETYFEAKQTGKFDFRFLRTLYSEKTFNTAVIKFPDTDPRYRLAMPLNTRKLEAIFEKSPSGADFLTGEGFEANPTLKDLLYEVRACHAITRFPLRKYRTMSTDLTKKSPIPDFVQGINVTASWAWWQNQLSPELDK